MLRALLIMTMALGLTGITSTLVQANDPMPQCLPCPPVKQIPPPPAGTAD
jgi:hypothetical protein